MIGYALLILLVFIIDNTKETLEKKYLYVFFVLFVFSGFRYGIGYDYFSYYENIMESAESEPIPGLLMFFSREVHYSIFFITSSFFINYFFIKGLAVSKTPYESVYLYLGLPVFFVSSLSIVRQYMAISVIFYLICLQNPSIKKKIAYIILAFLCHRSALITLFLLLPIEKWLNRKSLIVIFGLSIVLGELFVKYLLQMAVSSPFMIYFIRFLEMEVPGGFYKRIVIYVLALLVLLNYNGLTNRGVQRKFIVLTVVGASIFALFSVQSHIAERFCTFFFSSILLYFYVLRRNFKFPIFLYKWLCITFFIMQIYVGHITSSTNSDYSEYRDSLFYPYEMIFWNSPE